MAAAMLLAHGASATLTAPFDDALAYCWRGQGEFTKDRCCQGRGKPSCFDSIYTHRECCGDGWARLLPIERNEPIFWGLGASWSGSSGSTSGGSSGPRSSNTSAGPRWLSRHPSFSERQRRWERQMAASSQVLQLEALGLSVELLAFKRAREALLRNLIEMPSDVYRLRQWRASLPGGDAPVFILDVGASIGHVTVLLCKLLGKRARVVAVEPIPANFRYLLWNIRHNGVAEQVWPINAALRGRAAFREPFRYSPISPTGAPLDPKHERLVSVEAQVATLPEILAAFAINEVQLLKIDCEGCEWEVLDPASLAHIRHRVKHATAELHGLNGLSDAEINSTWGWLCVHRWNFGGLLMCSTS